MTPGALAALLWLGAPGETLVDEAEPPRAPENEERRVHGEVRAGVGFGMTQEDGMATLRAGLALDLTDIVPLRFRLGAPVRLRLLDRDPDDASVVRGRDWDEPGDFVAILEEVSYTDELVFGRYGRVHLDLLVGTLGRVQLGHGTLVRGFGNSLDLDRRRAGLDVWVRVEGRRLGQLAGVEAQLIGTDLGGEQLFGARLGLDWAGAGVGVTAVGDPSAPHALQDGAPNTLVFPLDDDGSLIPEGSRGVTAVGLDLSYRASDGWRWMLLPYLDLNMLPGVGKGLHLGVDSELVVGRKRRVRLGFLAELSLGDRSYDPVYFDVFYLSQRWQVPFVAFPEDRPMDLTTTAQTKHAFVRSANLGVPGGHAAVRFSHRAGIFAETGYHFRPGPIGATWEFRAGVDRHDVELVALYAHRGSHGFEVHHLEGSVAQLEVRVPVLRWVDVYAAMGWMFATRPDPPGLDVDPTGFMGNAGFFELGVAGRVPW